MKKETLLNVTYLPTIESTQRSYPTSERQKNYPEKCDKAAGIIVLNFKDYMKAANKHLMSEHELDIGEKFNF